jgi:hypothetical protein
MLDPETALRLSKEHQAQLLREAEANRMQRRARRWLSLGDRHESAPGGAGRHGTVSDDIEPESTN